MKYECGCLMLKLDIPAWSALVRTLFDTNDIYETEIAGDYGLELTPHCTILLGINDSQFNLLDVVQRFPKININTDKIDYFRQQEYDVLKFNIRSQELHDINSQIQKLTNTASSYSYNPHATIAYLKPGTADKYVRKISKPYSFTPAEFDYSRPDGTHIYFKI